MSKVILKGFIVVPGPDLAAIQHELDNHTNLTLAEPGCIIFKVIQRQDNPFIFDVYEEFKDMASFELHQARVKASYWGKLSKNIERHYKLVEIP